MDKKVIERSGIPEVMRDTFANQFLDEILFLLTVIIPVGDNVAPKGPNVFFSIGWCVASGCSISATAAAPRRQRYLRGIRPLSTVVALQ